MVIKKTRCDYCKEERSDDQFGEQRPMISVLHFKRKDDVFGMSLDFCDETCLYRFLHHELYGEVQAKQS